MSDPKTFHNDIMKNIKSFLLVLLNREFLIFLFFLVLSGTFWLLMTLNETYEREITIPVRLVDIPDNIMLSSDTTKYVDVTVKDKGYYLLAYTYANKIQTLNVKFSSYAKKDGYGVIAASELKNLIYSQLFSSSRIVSVKPDKYEYFYNQGLNKRVPVKLFGRITPGASYYLSKIQVTPDSIDVYANEDLLDSIKYVNTEKLRILNITDTFSGNVPLRKIRGVKYIPEKVNLSICADILTEESFEVPIVAVNMPEGKKLRTFPSRVTVKFSVGASVFRTISPESFKVEADYNEIISNPSEKCNIYLRYIPNGVRNAKIDVKTVDYLIEEQ